MCKVVKQRNKQASKQNPQTNQPTKRPKRYSKKTLQGKVTCCRCHERAGKLTGDSCCVELVGSEGAGTAERSPTPARRCSRRLRVTTAAASC